MCVNRQGENELIADKDFDKLSIEDVKQLQDNPSVDIRMKTISKLSEQYKTHSLSQAENKITEDIFRLLLTDSSEKIRAELANNLKDIEFLPEDICLKIVQDSSEISSSFIQDSPALSEKCLINIVKQHDESIQSALANRQNLSFRVCEALVEEAPISVLKTLVVNERADISDYAYQRLIERVGENESIQRALLMRKNIPAHILAKLVGIVPEDLKKQLLMRRDLSAPLITTLVSQEREKAILSLAQSSTEEEVRTLVIHLNGINRLTPNLILRAAVVGDMKFFEYAIALRAGIPIRNTRVLIYDSGIMGLERIYEEAKLPKEMFPAIRLAVKTYKEMINETEDGYRDHFCRRLVERLLILFDENGIELDNVDMEYFLSKIGHQSQANLDLAV